MQDNQYDTDDYDDTSSLHAKVPGRSKRGFAAMDSKVQKQIASKGGRAAHEKGTAHEWTPEEAKRAGAEGGRR